SSTIYRYLLYVPNVSAINADPLVGYSSQAVYESVRDYVVANNLTQGQVIPKNSLRSPDYFNMGLHLEQELPGMIRDTTFKVYADVENLLNLIDNDYGSFRYYNPLSALVGVTCPAAAGGSCPKYSYNSFAAPTLLKEGRIGLWSVRFGFRLEF
ncbi:MAG: hypothetical protein ABIQ86_16810, partial [Steroidobacteraceae bacterium]